MNNLDDVSDFFKEIVPKVRYIVKSFGTSVSVSVYKGASTNYATEVDLAVEDLIVSELNSRFPEYRILAEEAYSEVEITEKPIWIIDPICGTSNLGSGRNIFCTNIALAIDRQLVAALVIDHSQADYFWSIGGNTVYINETPFRRVETDKGINVDVDMGSLPSIKERGTELEKYFRAISRIANDTDYMMFSLNTSLGCAYVAIGKMDGFINAYAHPWDIAAATFLITQSGGTITDLKGDPWQLTSGCAIAAKNKTIHKTLLNAYS